MSKPFLTSPFSVIYIFNIYYSAIWLCWLDVNVSKNRLM